MTLPQLFINAAGRLRSGWRLLIFAAAYIAALFLIGSLVRVFYAILFNVAPTFGHGRYLENVVYRLNLLVAALVSGYVCTRWLEGLPCRTLGLSLHLGWLRDLLVGSLLGLLSLGVATAMATVGGGLRFAGPNWSSILPITQTLILSAALFILAALAEEALFRGYPLQTFARARLAWMGILLTSIPFAAVHLSNPNVIQPFASINTALAGVWLAAAYLRTRSLWFPLGVHWSWNWTLGALFGLPVSGITEIAPNPLLRGTNLGPGWLTGGAYGIEGGLACTVTLIASTLFIWRTRLVSATEEMRILTSQENPVQPTVAVVSK
ncbi:MAG TPA: CPBP family intramembrane glutamic endopeptidase [Pyrinomonadaceae bacterium]|nr:CPBP family intramembrane glutamic endopeptidase [Pyrinomonadaceae bacterium]